MGFLDAAGGRGGLARRLGSELLAWRFASGAFTGAVMYVFVLGVSTKGWRRSKTHRERWNVRLLGTGHGFSFEGCSNDSVSEFVTIGIFRLVVSHDPGNQTITFWAIFPTSVWYCMRYT
jgi:hypothetical protein